MLTGGTDDDNVDSFEYDGKISLVLTSGKCDVNEKATVLSVDAGDGNAE